MDTFLATLKHVTTWLVLKVLMKGFSKGIEDARLAHALECIAFCLTIGYYGISHWKSPHCMARL